MRLILLLALLLVTLASQTFAQEAPPVEVFGGYSYLRPDGGGGLHGWNGSVGVNFNRWFGIAGDFSGHYGSQSLRTEILDDNFPGPVTIEANSDTNVHSILAGPRFSYREHEKVTPFAHALFGASRLAGDATIRFGPTSVDSSFSDIGFALAIGGGVDIRLSESRGLRLIQADYFMTRFGNGRQNNVRLSVGFTFH